MLLAYTRFLVLASFVLGLAPAKAFSRPLDGRIVAFLSATGPIGAGVLVSPDIVLSAYHVPKDNPITFVGCGDGTVAVAQTFAASQRLDLVMMRLVTPCGGTRVSTLALSSPDLGSVVFAVGCPGGFCGRVSRGVVSSYEYDETKDHPRLISDVKIWFGNSGGGLFDEDGSLLGICSAVQHFGLPVLTSAPTGDATADWAVFVPVPVIRDWAKQHGVYL